MIDQVPGYRILERAGEGGFSVVYRAHQERLDRIVALKVLSVDAVDSATMRRFERECQITGRLTGHPNVVTVLDTGMTSGGRPFIAMDYFERGSLRDRLSREGPLPLQDVLRAGVKIAGALAAVHEAEVLHRDVKPQNILVSKYGEPALADFGIARLVDSTEATHTNAFTPHHAAPEVVGGGQPGVTSDVYSLASTMYQLLAGAPAFKAGSASGLGALMMRILNEPPPPIRRLDVPPQVYEVLAKAMAKSPDQRYPSAVAFATRLQQLQAELGLPVTEPAGSDSVTGPPLPGVPETDHSGLTGPGFDLLAAQYAAHLPAAHPDAAPPPLEETEAGPYTGPNTGPRTGLNTASNIGPHGGPRAGPPPGLQGGPPPVAAPSSGYQAGLPPTPSARPYDPAGRHTPQHTPKTRPHPAFPAEVGRGGRNGALTAGVLAAALVGTGLGVGGFLVFGGGSDAGHRDLTQAPTQAGASTGAPTPTVSSTVPLSVMRAATPRNLRAIARGRVVELRWRLARNNDYAIWVQQADETGSAPPRGLPPHTLHVLMTGLDPHKGYCFKVGAMVAYGQSDGEPATIAWSKAKCVRGAIAR